jgi:hypothetical protein
MLKKINIPSIEINGSKTPDLSSISNIDNVISVVLLDDGTYDIEINEDNADQIDSLQAQIDALLILLAQQEVP